MWAQTPPEAQRLQTMGANVQRIVGDLKFDAPPNADRLKQHHAKLAPPVVMFASSREGEELELLKILVNFKPLAL